MEDVVDRNVCVCSLEDHRITAAADAMYFVRAFITAEEERAMMEEVDAAPKPKWTTLRGRRLQQWGGVPGGPDGTKPMLLEPMPPWLLQMSTRLKESLRVKGESFFSSTPNHVLINEYRPGQGIMGHEDGPLYEPLVAILNLESTLMLNVWKKGETDKQSVIMEARSLWVMTSDVYANHLHGIEAREADVYTFHGPAPASAKTWLTSPTDASGKGAEDLIADAQLVNWGMCSEEWRACVKAAAVWDEDLKTWTATMPRDRRVSLTVRSVKNTKKMPSEKLLAAIFGKKR